jgi:putative salt-induced outer membrane protein
MRSRFASLFALALFFAAGKAAAQPSPAGAGAPTETAPTGLTKSSTSAAATNDIAKGGMVASAEKKADDPAHVNDVSIGAGGLFSAGNARQIALTALGRLRLRREEHQFSSAVSLNAARAGKKGEEVSTTVENYQGLVRYDYFLNERISLFLQTTGRRDRFQGLDLRLNVDPGIAYYFLNEKTHRLQGEAGYDLQHDIRRDEALTIPPPAGAPPGTLPTKVDKTRTLHNARLFLGYENKLRKEVSLVTSVEYLQNFADVATYRFIFDIGLKSNVADNLALAVAYTARYENKPLPNIESLDSIMSINLVYSFF